LKNRTISQVPSKVFMAQALYSVIRKPHKSNISVCPNRKRQRRFQTFSTCYSLGKRFGKCRYRTRDLNERNTETLTRPRRSSVKSQDPITFLSSAISTSTKSSRCNHFWVVTNTSRLLSARQQVIIINVFPAFIAPLEYLQGELSCRIVWVHELL
jgi:hypothetical protein